jgi:succinate dehydrogenase / fumarate reductase cytochrome b subunit
MNKIIGIFREIRLNFNISMILFILMRITGIGLVVFLFIHIWTLSSVWSGPEAVEHAFGKYDNLFGYFLEYLLLLTVAVHGINGIRIVIMDIWPLTRAQKTLLWTGLLLVLIIAVLSLKVFFPYKYFGVW